MPKLPSHAERLAVPGEALACRIEASEERCLYDAKMPWKARHHPSGPCRYQCGGETVSVISVGRHRAAVSSLKSVNLSFLAEHRASAEDKVSGN